jgi:hypothetical protein
MATRTAALAYSNSTDALFRLWINEVHNALIAFGWTQTADTGQINFSTVTRPTTTNSFVGYAVYAMGDSLQSTCAVYMRLDFGTTLAQADGPGLKVQICIGSTNGAGTLIGNVATQQTLNPNLGASATVLWAMRTAGSSSSFRFKWGSDGSTSTGFIFAVERDQDANGADASTGVNFLTNWQTTWNSQFLELAGGTGAVEARWLAAVSSGASQAAGGFVGVGPVRCQLGALRNPMKTVVVFARGDFADNATTQLVLYGTSRTYLMFCLFAGQAVNTWNTNCGVAFLWQ